MGISRLGLLETCGSHRVGRIGLAGQRIEGGSADVRCPGRKADDADAVGGDLELVGIGPQELDAALRVEPGFGGAVERLNAIAQDEGRDAAFLEPLGDENALEVDAARLIAAARADENGGPGVLGRIGQEGVNCRLILTGSAGVREARPFPRSESAGGAPD